MASPAFIELTDTGNNRVCLPVDRIGFAENGGKTNVYFDGHCMTVDEKYEEIQKRLEGDGVVIMKY